MTSLKLTIKQWALVSLSAITGLLVLLLGYKSKQLSAAHVALLRATFAHQIDSINIRQQALAKSAKTASQNYSAARRKYEQEHGPV